MKRHMFMKRHASQKVTPRYCELVSSASSSFYSTDINDIAVVRTDLSIDELLEVLKAVLAVCRDRLLTLLPVGRAALALVSSCVCMCVCMYVCIYIYIYMYVCM
jgi:hypothetical protein